MPSKSSVMVNLLAPCCSPTWPLPALGSSSPSCPTGAVYHLLGDVMAAQPLFLPLLTPWRRRHPARDSLPLGPPGHLRDKQPPLLRLPATVSPKRKSGLSRLLVSEVLGNQAEAMAPSSDGSACQAPSALEAGRGPRKPHSPDAESRVAPFSTDKGSCESSSQESPRASSVCALYH